MRVFGESIPLKSGFALNKRDLFAVPLESRGKNEWDFRFNDMQVGYHVAVPGSLQAGSEQQLRSCESKPNSQSTTPWAVAEGLLHTAFLTVIVHVHAFADREVRAGPLVRVKAKFTVRNTVYVGLRRQYTRNLFVNLTLTFRNGVALNT